MDATKGGGVRHGLRRLWRPERWRNLLLRDVPVKLLSLAVAFGLWVFVNASERDTELPLQVPLELRSLPAALMVTSPSVDFIDLRVSGPRTLLSRIDRDQLSLPLDLAGVRPGPAVFRMSVDALELPRGVKVVRLTPAQITLDLERILRVEVPVDLKLDGNLPEWLRIVEKRVSPESVEVTGPASTVKEIGAVETEPLSLADAVPGVVEREVLLSEVSEYISLSADRVTAHVQLAEIEVERKFSGVSVSVRNTELLATLEPKAIRVTVKGPKRTVESLELGAGEVYIDAADAAPGRSKRAPSVDLPPGVKVVLQEPAQVRLRLTKGQKK